MKVLLIVPRAGNRATGPTVAIAGLQRALLRRGVGATVHSAVSKVGGSAEVALAVEDGWHVHQALSVIPAFEALRMSPSMYRALATGIQDADVVHNNGMWAGITTLAGHAAGRASRPVIWSPRGTLDPVAFRQRRLWKSLQWRFVQEKLLKRVACFHATCEHEATHLRNCGLQVPIAIVPHGIDVPPMLQRSRNRSEKKRVLFLSRVAPVKGLPLLIEAWSKLESTCSEWELTIAGPDFRGHRKQVEKLIEDRGLRRVHFVGEVQGDDKTKTFAKADLFILPSEAENFGLAIAEALGHGVPVIVTHGTPWRDVERRGCGWWVERTTEALHDTLLTAMNLSADQRLDMGQRGQEWMSAEFSWEVVARKMEVTYQWVLDGGSPPTWVQIV